MSPSTTGIDDVVTIIPGPTTIRDSDTGGNASKAAWKRSSATWDSSPGIRDGSPGSGMVPLRSGMGFSRCGLALGGQGFAHPGRGREGLVLVYHGTILAESQYPMTNTVRLPGPAPGANHGHTLL